MNDDKEERFLEKVGNNIRWLRRLRDLSQEGLGFKSQLDRTYVGGIERGERNPTILNIKKIADALDVPVEMILSDDLEKRILGHKNEEE